ncbi:MAG: alpha/beta hydrolase [Gallionella sp.]|nr:alpha/beta hydrolase [Gallionella sp.]MDD4946986.1 alpha/beta hydrolase [Gallionella sp.]MDD5612576.1 alpha/beta hydrolase [Gallionella sp.]
MSGFFSRNAGMRHLIGLLALFSLLGGCATPPKAVEPADEAISRGTEPNFSIQRVHFATDRAATGNPEPDKRFGGERGDISYGYCDVSIPRDHRMGELEGPSIWRLEFRPDPNKHIVLASVETQASADFFDSLKQRIQSSDGRKAFVFIHGFNVGFEEAARRTAQMSYDLAFPGVPIFFSWPSRAQLMSYRNDEKNANWSVPHLKAFFADLAANLDADEIFVIAHSMGNQPTSRALAELFTERPELVNRFKDIMLVAPDIDADVFKNEIAPPLLASGRHMTLYASSKDMALKFSEMINGGQRLGDADPSIVVLPGMDSIDASNVKTDLIGHSYYADANSVLSDIFEVVRSAQPETVHSRIEEVITAFGRFWRFKIPAGNAPAAP